MKRLWKYARRILLVCVLALLTVVVLFAVNGLLLAHGETPMRGVTTHPPREADEPEITVLAYNIAKGYAYEGGASFANADDVRNRIEGMAQLIRAEKPDFVFLSEGLKECTPCPVDQITLLANKTDMHCWCFGENFNFGLPFYRIVSGNAILARGPITPVANPSLVGRQPFYITKNNRRVLWCEAKIGNNKILLGSIHNDSFDLKSNHAQMQQILDYAKDRPAILAGDFNAQPHDESIRLIAASKRFTPVVEEPLTFPAEAPKRRIDFVFAPADWTLIEQRVLDSTLSDHKAVVCRFRLPAPK